LLNSYCRLLGDRPLSVHCSALKQDRSCVKESGDKPRDESVVTTVPTHIPVSPPLCGWQPKQVMQFLKEVASGQKLNELLTCQRDAVRSPHRFTPNEAKAVSVHAARCNAQMEAFMAIPPMKRITFGKNAT
jgi:hypothetical protein